MVIDTYIIYESLEVLLCYNIIGGVGIPVSLRYNGLSIVRIRGSSVPSRTLYLLLGEQLHVLCNRLNKTILPVGLLGAVDMQPTWMYI